jgi:hypothetical protein
MLPAGRKGRGDRCYFLDGMTRKENYFQSMIPKGIAVAISLLLVTFTIGGTSWAFM